MEIAYAFLVTAGDKKTQAKFRKRFHFHHRKVTGTVEVLRGWELSLLKDCGGFFY